MTVRELINELTKQMPEKADNDVILEVEHIWGYVHGVRPDRDTDRDVSVVVVSGDEE